MNLEDCIYLRKELEIIGFDYVCVSSGGLISKTDFSKHQKIEKKIYIISNFVLPLLV